MSSPRLAWTVLAVGLGLELIVQVVTTAIYRSVPGGAWLFPLGLLRVVDVLAIGLVAAGATVLLLTRTTGGRPLAPDTRPGSRHEANDRDDGRRPASRDEQS